MASAPRRLGVVTLSLAAVGTSLLLPSAVAVASTHARPASRTSPSTHKSFMERAATTAQTSLTLAAPTLKSPANDPNAAHPIQDVVLSWNPVVGATSYVVQISPNGQFTNNAVTLPDGGATVDTTYDVPISLPHASYFWRVEAVNGSTTSDWSTANQFLYDWDDSSTPNGTFNETGPSGTDPLFSWAPVPDASLYLVRVSTDPSFPTGSTTFDCSTAGTSFEPYEIDGANSDNIDGDCFDETNLTNGTIYYWQVIPYDDSSAAPITAADEPDSDWECAQAQPECDAGYVQPQVGSFTFQAPAAGTFDPATAAAPTNLVASTSDGTTSVACTGAVCPTTPTLSWNPVAGANLYRVFVYLDADGTNNYRVYETAYTSLTPRDLFPGDQAGKGYYWAVQAGTCENAVADPTCQSPGNLANAVFSSNFGGSSFKVQTGAVTLSTPANGATVTSRDLTFSWSDYLATGGAGTSEARNYDLQISKTPDFAKTVVDDPNIDLTQYSPTDALPSGTYYWRVAPIDESGNQLEWSSTNSIVVDNTGPAVSIKTKNGVSVSGPIEFTSNGPLQNVSLSGPEPSLELTNAAGQLVPGSLKKGSGNTYDFRPSQPLVTGETYLPAVEYGVTDALGNQATPTGKGVQTTLEADNTSPGWSYAGTWKANSDSSAIGGSLAAANKGSKAKVTVYGSSATVYACKAPKLGSISISVDGKVVKTVALTQNFDQCGLSVWSGSLKKGENVVTIAVTKGLGDFDAVKVTGAKSQTT